MTTTPLPTGWKTVKKQDTIVDLNSVTGLYLYDVKSNSLLTKLDYIDPNKGKILGTAQQDLDYISNFDPAKYNIGTTDTLPIDPEFHWGDNQLGKTWWDLDNARYFDYEQDSLQYRISNWGRLFPGSTVEVYEWVSADVLPSEYVAASLNGIPKYEDDRAYVEIVYVDEVTGVINSKYYYWVRSKNTKIDPTKTHSVVTLADMISNPKTQGIPYAAILKDNSVSLFNIGEYLSESDTALHIGYQTSLNENIIHSEYELVQENNDKRLVPPRIIKKLLDSLIGADATLNVVPDFKLSAGNKLGLGIRPRQTLIINRLAMVEKIVDYLNTVLIQHPVSSKLTNNYLTLSDNLYAMAPLPATSLYDTMVDSREALTLRLNSPGDRVLVTSDSTYNGYWTIYHINSASIPVLKTIQAFDVTKFWKFVNWYATGYSNTTKINYTVKLEKDLYKLSLKKGDIVKITNNGYGKFEIYLYSSAETRSLIGLENGTIELSKDLWKSSGFDSENLDMDYFDKNCFIEFRYILAGLADDLFVDELLEEYNKLLFVLIYCILAEQQTIDWAFKTSFISLKQEIDGLLQPSRYSKDKWDYYIDYITEIKPYRTKIREYIISHRGLDPAAIAISDFDLPAYYDRDLNVFRSPNGEYVNKDAILFNKPKYVDWKNHHTYGVGSIELVSAGYGYFYSHILTGTVSTAVTTDYVTVTSTSTMYVGQTIKFGTNVGGIIQGILYYILSVVDSTRITIGFGGKIVTLSNASVTTTIELMFPSPPDISIISSDGNGSGAKAYATVNTSNGSIQKIYVTNQGSGYTSTPLVKISGIGVTPVTVPIKYKVISRGYNDTTGTLASGLYDGESGSLIYSATRSYTLHRIRIYDGALVFSKTYDIYGNVGKVAELTADLNNTSKDYIVIVQTDDEPQANVFNTLLQTAMYRCGASSTRFGAQLLFKRRSSYILVGRPTSGEGNGIEIYNGADALSTCAVCEFDFSMYRGQLIVTRIVPEQSIVNLGYDILPEEYDSYDEASRDITDKDYAGLLDIPVSRWAQAVPILTNVKTRKLKSTIKFDRISYTSRVIDWEKGGFDSVPYSEDIFEQSYPPNSLVQYQGQGYINEVEAPGSGRFDFGIFKLIDSGTFDNANDRIMACYQPTLNMPPRVLSSLVPGIELESAANSNDQVPADSAIFGGLFSSSTGISTANIIISGGTFINQLYSHSPDEHIPGTIYDSVSISVLSSLTGTMGFRMFVDINEELTYTNITHANITTLAEPLHITDEFITVTDGNTLPTPNAPGLVPGIVYIDGERIQYYTKAGAVLGQLTRGCGGTGVSDMYHAGTPVEDISVQQAIIAPSIIAPHIY